MSKYLIILLLLSVSFHFPPEIAEGSEVKTGVTLRRISDLRINVVFVGITPEFVNTSYLRWNLPKIKYQQYLNPGIETGVQHRLNYDFFFAKCDFENSFSKYLISIGKVEFVKNPFFGINLTNTLYPANLAQNWLKFHESELGDLKPGYTLVLANLTGKIPSVTSNQYIEYLNKSITNITPHYYNVTYGDSDLHITLKRRWMTSWGGSERLYFMDLSAGPSNITGQLPLQWAIKANNISLHTHYGSKWLNQFLADHIYGPVEGLFAPDFIYPLQISKKYVIDILVIDNRTDNGIPTINRTLDSHKIKSELSNLLPFAEIKVMSRFINVTSSIELTNLVVDSTNPGKYDNISIVDARPLYHWLNEDGKGHLKDFFNVSEINDQFRIPVMAFVFSGEYELGFTFKEDLSDLIGSKSIWGVALGDLILVGHSAHDLIRGNFTDPKQYQKGFGLTNTIIHEVGHMIGLPHPFSIDSAQNFVSSVMSYYPYEYCFSEFEKDALIRGYVDNLLMTSIADLDANPPNILNQGLLSSINEQISFAEIDYANMDYRKAFERALEIRRETLLTRDIGSLITTSTYVALNMIVVVVGVNVIIFGSRFLMKVIVKKLII